jgi:hypothetical protein
MLHVAHYNRRGCPSARNCASNDWQRAACAARMPTLAGSNNRPRVSGTRRRESNCGTIETFGTAADDDYASAFSADHAGGRPHLAFSDSSAARPERQVALMSGILPYVSAPHPVWSPLARTIHEAVWDRRWAGSNAPAVIASILEHWTESLEVDEGACCSFLPMELWPEVSRPCPEKIFVVPGR